jgi:hypothetical protein
MRTQLCSSSLFAVLGFLLLIFKPLVEVREQFGLRFKLKLNLQENKASKSVSGKGQYEKSVIFVEFAGKQSFEVGSGRRKSSLGK